MCRSDWETCGVGGQRRMGARHCEAVWPPRGHGGPPALPLVTRHEKAAFLLIRQPFSLAMRYQDGDFRGSRIEFPLLMPAASLRFRRLTCRQDDDARI